MPFVMDYTDETTGANYPESYWWARAFSQDYEQRRLDIIFQCHVSATAQAEGKKGLPLGKSYSLTGADFVSFVQQFASVTLSPIAPINIALWLEKIALDTKDVGSGEDAVSFFEEAQQVAPDLSVLQ